MYFCIIQGNTQSVLRKQLYKIIGIDSHTQIYVYLQSTQIAVLQYDLPGEIPAQRQVTRNFDVFIDLRLNKRLRKQAWG